MKSYVWNEEKNRLLQNERGISFEDIVDAISNGDLLDSIKNPSSEKYSNQSVFIVNVKGYVYCVPYVEDESITPGETFRVGIFEAHRLQSPCFWDVAKECFYIAFGNLREIISSFERDQLPATG